MKAVLSVFLCIFALLFVRYGLYIPAYLHARWNNYWLASTQKTLSQNTHSDSLPIFNSHDFDNWRKIECNKDNPKNILK